MRNVAIGFLAGVVLAGLAFVYLATAPESPLAPSATSHAETPMSLNTAGRTSNPAASDNVQEESGSVLTASVEAALPTVDELERRRNEARRALDAAEREFRRAERVTRWADEPPPSLPIVLPGEFRYLSDDPNDLHEELQREAIDPVWAAATESHIHGYLAARPEITGRYGYPTVHCRTTRCEIAFVAHGVGEAEDFRVLNAEFYGQDWTDQFELGGLGGPINADVRNQGDVTTILWGLKQVPERLRANRRTEDDSP